MITAKKLSNGVIYTVTLEEDHLFKTYMEIYKEHNTYHVRCFKRVKGSSSVDRISWENFDTLKEATVYFKKMIAFYK